MRSAIRERVQSFRWFGGKNSQLDFILPKLIQNPGHFAEPFCASLAILLNREPAPCETINDLNPRIMNFYRVLRERPIALIRSIKLTPYSQEEFEISRIRADESLEEARRFFIRTQMEFSSIHSATSSRMRIQTKAPQYSSPPHQMQNSVRNFRQIAARLLRVQMPGPMDGIKLIEQLDSPDCHIYCDPTYLHETRISRHAYEFEMSDMDHRRLLDVCRASRARIAVSGYASTMYDEFFRRNCWVRFEYSVRSTSGQTKGARTEVLWTNYDPGYENFQRGTR